MVKEWEKDYIDAKIHVYEILKEKYSKREDQCMGVITAPFIMLAILWICTFADHIQTFSILTIPVIFVYLTIACQPLYYIRVLKKKQKKCKELRREWAEIKHWSWKRRDWRKSGEWIELYNAHNIHSTGNVIERLGV